MALTARSLHELENQQSLSRRDLLDHYVVEQQQLWGSPGVRARGPTGFNQPFQTSRIPDLGSKHHQPGASHRRSNGSPPRAAARPGPHLLRDPPKGTDKSLLQPVSSNSSIIQRAPQSQDLAELDQNVAYNGSHSPPINVDRRRTTNYQKRSRHKMREKGSNANRSSVKRKEAASATFKKRKKGINEARIPKNRSDALGERFSSQNVANPRITLRPSHRLGIFKKGREAGHAVPDLSFPAMPFLQRKPTLDIGAYDEHLGRSREKTSHQGGDPPSPAKSPPRLPSTDDFSACTAVKGVAVEPIGHGLEIGPYDSISQVSVRPNLKSPDLNGSDDRSEYSRLGYQSRFLNRQGTTSAHNRECTPTASTFAQTAVSTARGSRHLVTSAQSIVTPANASTELHHREAATEEGKVRPPDTQLPNNASSDDTLDPLEQILRLCKRLPTPQQSNKVESDAAHICSPTPSHVTLDPFHHSVSMVPILRIPDEQQYAAPHTPVLFQGTTGYFPNAPGGDQIGTDNECGDLWGNSYYDQFYEGHGYGSGFPIMTRGWDDDITEYHFGGAAEAENSTDNGNGNLHEHHPARISPSSLSLDLHHDHGSVQGLGHVDTWIDAEIYGDTESVKGEEILDTRDCTPDHVGQTMVEQMWHDRNRGLYPYQHERGTMDLNVPRNFWRPHRLS